MEYQEGKRELEKRQRKKERMLVIELEDSKEEVERVETLDNEKADVDDERIAFY